MNRTLTTELAAHVGGEVRLAGWLHRKRELRTVTFVVLRDAHGLAQIVVEDAPTRELLAAIPAESAIEVRGDAVAAPQAPGGVEVHAPRFTLLSAARSPLPIELHRPALGLPMATLLDYAPLALRHPRQRAIFELSAASTAGFRAALEARDFVEIHTPKLVSSATESGANVFELDYFGRQAFLAQSPQLYKQIMVGVFERVFEVGPVFRAEPHDTPRHLNQYTSLDVELGFIDDHTTVMALVGEVLRGMLAAIVDRATGAVELLGLELPRVPHSIPHIQFRAAQELILEHTGEDVRGEPDLAPAHERWLGAWAEQTYNSAFLFVVGYPMVKRPFYTFPDPEQPLYSRSFDLLFRGLELVTGGQRLHRYVDYERALAERGLDAAPLAGYLDAFRYGMPPHGGFAIGLERWVARLVGAANVRETTLFPRDLHRLTP